MAGNQQRRNARTSNKKGMVVGSGGQRRKQVAPVSQQPADKRRPLAVGWGCAAYVHRLRVQGG